MMRKSLSILLSLGVLTTTGAIETHNAESEPQKMVAEYEHYLKYESPIARMEIEIEREKAEKDLQHRLELARIEKERLEKERLRQEEFNKGWFNVAASHYSDGEYHNGPGNYSTNAIGTKLEPGTIAVPFQNGKCVIPMYSILILEDNNGNKESVMALDTGNSKYIRMITAEDKAYNPFFQREIFQDKDMLIDYYMPNTDLNTIFSMGHKEYRAKVVRYGKDKIINQEQYEWAVNNLPWQMKKYI